MSRSCKNIITESTIQTNQSTKSYWRQQRLWDRHGRYPSWRTRRRSEKHDRKQLAQAKHKLSTAPQQLKPRSSRIPEPLTEIQTLQLPTCHILRKLLGLHFTMDTAPKQTTCFTLRQIFTKRNIKSRGRVWNTWAWHVWTIWVTSFNLRRLFTNNVSTLQWKIPKTLSKNFSSFFQLHITLPHSRLFRLEPCKASSKKKKNHL